MTPVYHPCPETAPSTEPATCAPRECQLCGDDCTGSLCEPCAHTLDHPARNLQVHLDLYYEEAPAIAQRLQAALDAGLTGMEAAQCVVDLICWDSDEDEPSQARQDSWMRAWTQQVEDLLGPEAL